jgi:uncharacterized membrane protein
MQRHLEHQEVAMRKNMGTADRAVRLVAAAGAVAGSGVLGFSAGWGIVLLAVAAVMAGTTAIGYCPLYRLLRITTTSAREAKAGGHRMANLHRAA